MSILGYLMLSSSPKQQKRDSVEKNSHLSSDIKYPELNDSEMIHEFTKFTAHFQKNRANKPTLATSITLFSKVEQPPFTSKNGISPLFSLKIDKKRLENLKEGNQISLPDLGGINYQASIEKRKRHQDGSLSLIAKIDDEYEHYSIIITLGKQKSFATLHTPEGSFELETEGELGYLYAVEEIDTKWIDYNQEDTLALSHS